MTHTQSPRLGLLHLLLIPTLAVVAPALALYLLTATWPDTPDGLFHLHRVRALAEALRMGVLYPRWFPDFAFGYGYPVLNFYAPLFYYPPALLHLAGLDLIVAVRVTLAAWYAFSGLATYALLRRWVHPLPAALGAVFYLAFPYRLYDLFVRGALPEFAAFLWPPLIAWATVRWLKPTHESTLSGIEPSGGLATLPAKASSPEQWAAIFRVDATCGAGRTRADEKPHPRPLSYEKRDTSPPAPLLRGEGHLTPGPSPTRRGELRPATTSPFPTREGGRGARSPLAGKGAGGLGAIFRVGPLLIAALSWAGLILTHNLTALMAALVGLGAAVTWTVAALIRKMRSSRGQLLLVDAWAWALPLALGTLLSGPYTLPALLETGWVGLGATPETGGYAAHFASPGALFDFSLLYRYPAAAQPTVPVPGHVALLLIAAGGLMLLPAARGHRAGLGAGIGIALATLWLSTESSAFVWDALAPVLGKLQFPWRWQAIAALASATVFAWTLEVGGQWLGTRSPFVRSRWWAWGGALALTAYLAFHALGGLSVTPAPFSSADLTPEQMWDFDAKHGQVGASWAGEFLSRWVTEQRWAIGREPSSGANLPQPPQAIQAVQVLAHGYLGERLRYETSTPGRLIFHVFYYPAWRVRVDGQPFPTYPLGDLGLLAVDVPAGQHTVERSWGATPAAWAGRAAAVLGWLAVLGLLVVQSRWRRLAVGLWLAIALLGVIGGSDWLAREQIPSPIGADYGTVRLESALVTPARPGEATDVTLYWLVIGAPEPLTAFVHVLTLDGQMIAGHDAPLAGSYTPASRWQIGQLLPDRHFVSLPADLPSGAYRLLAGVYRPEQAATPLTPAGANPADPRVDIGFLEVRP